MFGQFRLKLTNRSYTAWYTRLIGIFFVLVAFSLISDYAKFGFRPETMHKIFHVALGAIVLRWGWNNPAWWRPFAIGNGAFFSYLALFGWIFPDFGGSTKLTAGGLDAFNGLDTILHSIVGATGLFVGLLGHKLQRKVKASKYQPPKFREGYF